MSCFGKRLSRNKTKTLSSIAQSIRHREKISLKKAWAKAKKEKATNDIRHQAKCLKIRLKNKKTRKYRTNKVLLKEIKKATPKIKSKFGKMCSA